MSNEALENPDGDPKVLHPFPNQYDIRLLHQGGHRDSRRTSLRSGNGGPLGSTKTSDFAGTVCLEVQTFHAMLRDVLQNAMALPSVPLLCLVSAGWERRSWFRISQLMPQTLLQV